MYVLLHFRLFWCIKKASHGNAKHCCRLYLHTTPSTVLYVGFVSSGHYTHYGGGDDYLCLVEKPQYLYSGSITDQSWIYSTEYKTNNQVFSGTHNWDVPCAVCFTPEFNNDDARFSSVLIFRILRIHRIWT